ncbi:MAG: 6-carboxytetrahydropterin synthase QueD [Nitrospirae bacterium CG_4_10_14_3_um_filter_44_29]|jgi:6-pyruvoyltetrahydropterin/6-carboxytetrahydropterin synthase|nr:6-carboxytetrahydropterin synthase QueD [Nitrospirota bacterium]OIO31075.1 MAG: 6-carboxytetrahydropterin synthase QueD [Nitrospirae bacterium CG1_02_44_142]PIP69707.1 MAG: 6-carboxytetrahydropterin synthase QueD [Nitrospirae bacterium CG22_combo_CG10-13_8_21_14_all_44_11]PIV40118.1 MAG: 6-carboxytetrahydropterin synthase QueD [Nitrospirae bacterium CG02_land_8_20_14_3_00_44_33]PIV67000.1 MAG: 6-carboxytetrahydropterin synthase QueD [Nitrospirae bacterium CG01_land_8_20_14_3_00_44_22]PIW893
MFELTVDTTFAAAHQLRGYKGKCERLHGHNWKVQAHVAAEKLNGIDIAIDFHDLKRLLNEVIAPLDHSFLNDIFPFTEKNPSSENIARWIYDSLNKKLADEDVEVSAVTVWESDTASATYYEN